jgi:hypothetical protein
VSPNDPQGEIAMNETGATHDLVRNSEARLLLWGLPTAVMLLTLCFAGDAWIVTLTWTLSLVVMGGACLVNARDCGRTHCYFTGPFFLLMAAASLSYGLGWLPLGPHGWLYLGAALLAGGGFFGFVPEKLWGRYRRAQVGTHER